MCSPSRGFPRPPRAQVAPWTLPPAARSSGWDASPAYESLAAVCAGNGCLFLPDLPSGPPLPRVLPPTSRLVDAPAFEQPPLRGRCATRDGTAAEARAAAASLAAAKAPDPSGGVFVRVVWHVVHAGATGKLTRAAVEAQVAHLNAAWGGVPDAPPTPGWAVAWRPDTPRPTGIFFTLADLVFHADADFFAGCSPTSGPAKSAAWNVDTVHTMNVYSCEPKQGLLGWTNFPRDMQGENDGSKAAVFVRWDTLPRVAPAGSTPYGLGNTLVHEAGHYFGLFHVFQGESCAGEGDGVADTTQQKAPTYGSCASNRDKATCAPGLDNIQNFMDYTDDDCMRLFTPQQVQVCACRACRPLPKPLTRVSRS